MNPTASILLLEEPFLRRTKGRIVNEGILVVRHAKLCRKVRESTSSGRRPRPLRQDCPREIVPTNLALEVPVL